MKKNGMIMDSFMRRFMLFRHIEIVGYIGI